MQQDSWSSSDMELTVRSKLAGLDEAYNVFNAPIYKYIAFDLLLWQYFRMMPFSNKSTWG